MTTSVLVDNRAGSQTPAEHGLSFLIEYDGKRILLDTGQSGMFLKNADIMNVNMKSIDMIVLSHGHYDHGNGLPFINGGKLLCHPGCFARRYRKTDHQYIGLTSSRDELSGMFNLITSSKPYKISDRIYFLGEIPRLTDFESKTTTFIFEDGSEDFIIDDSALALVMPDGLFVTTGCGHAGIINTIEHAMKITGIRKLFGVTGGFHLKENDHQTKETINYLKKSGVKHILPSHCTELPVLAAFYENFHSRQVKAGDIISY